MLAMHETSTYAWLAVLVVAWCGAPACARDPAPAPPPPGFVDVRDTIERACAGIDNAYECAKAAEQYRLGKGAPSVSRVGKWLTIALADGRVADFTDSPDPSAEDYVAYTYAEYLACFGYHLVRKQSADREGWIMIQAESGARADLPGIPVLAPNCERFVAVAGLPDAGSVLQVWRWNEGGRASLEWAYQPDVAWTPGIPTWRSATQWRLPYESDDEPGTTRTLAARLYTDGWRVDR
jgi:hypothetical protein